MDRNEFFLDRFTKYRNQGFDMLDSVTMARMDTNDRFGRQEVKLASNYVGSYPETF